MVKNDAFDDISCSIKHFRKSMEEAMPELRAEVDAIIGKKGKYEPQITYLLDTFINISGMGLGKEEFERLNAYYAGINKEVSDDYAKIYKEFIGDIESGYERKTPSDDISEDGFLIVAFGENIDKEDVKSAINDVAYAFAKALESVKGKKYSRKHSNSEALRDSTGDR